MRTEEDLFHELKNSSDLTPNNEFINKTRNNLMKQARKMDSRRKFMKKSYYISSTLASVLMIYWIFFLGGTQFISTSFNHLSSAININSIKGPSIENKPITDLGCKSTKPEVFIYHTHNTESFRSFTGETIPYASNDHNENITAVGKKLSQFLNEKNVPALHNDADINSILKEKGWSFSKSYEVSGEIVQSALNKYENLKLVIDIHRDSQIRSDTTYTINGQDVGRIALIVSKNSKKFKENKRIADLVGMRIEEKYPGLLRGVFIKEPYNDGTFENQNYNQDLFGQSLLIEVGGVENTLEEEFRSIEILSEVIKDVLNEL